MPNRTKGKGKTCAKRETKSKAKSKDTTMSEGEDSSADIISTAQDPQQESQQCPLLTLEQTLGEGPPGSSEYVHPKKKESAYASQEDIHMSTPSPPLTKTEEENPEEENPEEDTLTETPKPDKGKQKAVLESESSPSSPMPDSESDEYASSSEYERNWISDDDNDEEGGIEEMELSEARPSEAGPSSQPHKRQKTETPVQPPSVSQQQQQQQQQRFYAYSWDVQFDYPGSSLVCICLQAPELRSERQTEARFIVRQEDFYLQLNRVLGHMRPLTTTIEAATPSPASRAAPLTTPYPLYRACIRLDESGILELLHSDWVSSIPEALRSLYNVLVVAPTRFRGNWPIGPEEFAVFEGRCSGCGKQRRRGGERRWYQVIVQAFFEEEPERNWGRGVEEVGVEWQS